jgi:hypothetical protein|tara:strand:+ start:836 stop:1066 length:231 start_codon:yes stop_codon:yes gene_type:complete
METENVQNTITMNDVSYSLDAMSNKGKHLLNHIRDLEIQISTGRRKLDQKDVCLQAFTKLLADELEHPEDPEAESE